MKVGIVVGRFQTYAPHDGHLELLTKAASGKDHLLIFIGSVWKQPSHNNPLPFERRALNIRGCIEQLKGRGIGIKAYSILPLPDRGSNREWVENLDRLVHTLFSVNRSYSYSEITFYAGRDSGMAAVYKAEGGKYELVVIDEKYHVNYISATRQREVLVVKPEDLCSKSVVWTTQQQFPKVYATVDCILRDKAGFIVLIRKHGETLWQFPGGFSDPAKDTSFEAACRREVREECGDIEITDPRYICSISVDDPRYRNEKDKIITTLFTASLMFGRLQAGDDAKELLGFAEGNVNDNLQPMHRPLWAKYLEWIKTNHWKPV